MTAVGGATFGAYSRYYDLLYRDKDYAAEAAHVATLLASHGVPHGRLLELGCGTGVHASLLAARGWDVTGVDRSDAMVGQARERQRGLPPEVGARMRFDVGDARDWRGSAGFDAVVALFHVVSYQTSQSDLDAVFATAASQLRPGGVWLFDVWFGPAVLTDRPAVRVRRMADDHTEVTRIAEPVMFPTLNRVDVHYEIQVLDRRSGQTERLREVHAMRYLFLPELDALMARHGFEPVHAAEWLTGREPGWDTWSTCHAGRLVRPPR